MKFSNISNHINIPTIIKRVHIVDFDNMQDDLQINMVDQENTIIIGSLFDYDGIKSGKLKNFSRNLKHAAFRIIEFNGETISDMGDHLISFMAARWLSLNASMKTADWNIHTNDNFGKCLNHILTAFGVSSRMVSFTRSTYTTVAKMPEMPDISGSGFEFVEGMKLGAIASMVDRLGGFEKVFNVQAGTKMLAALKLKGFIVYNGQVYSPSFTGKMGKTK